ncbi:MAG: LysM peptidoglycan-binding domain-containing protein [Bacteroidetes bacterium]|nr:LysM peptidoglycan-binding domain-containing protein [Bacteroidota bacterium]
MSKSFLVVLFSIVFFTASAQDDSLHVFPQDNSWLIMYTVHNGETVFALSRRFHVPPAILTGVNGLNYQSALANNSLINIPTGAYNLLKSQPVNPDEARPLYYRATSEDNLYKLSRYSGVSQRTLQEWNKLQDTRINAGQILFVGWVMYDATNITVPSANTDNSKQKAVAMGYGAAAPEQKNVGNKQVSTKNGVTTTIIKSADTIKRIDTPAIVKLYLKQTNNEQNIAEDKGPAVFFDMKSVTSRNAFYAFYNGVPRGIIIKVHDPSSEVAIYVKVIGPLPDTKQYVGATIGISGNAKAMFKINRDKLWCELRYAK